MKKVFFVIFIALMVLSVAGLAYAADAASKTAKPAAAPAKMPAKRTMQPQMDRNFMFILGSITKIDTTDPNNVKVEVINEADNTNHVVEVGPASNILKVIEVTDLQAGEKVRIMARKVDNKELAMSVVTGKLKEMPRMRPAQTPAQAMTPVPAAKQPETKK